MNSFQWQMSMQVLNCLEIEDFIEIYGEQTGRWIWAKHVGQYKHDTIGFICYLDMGNCKKLHDYILMRINKMDPDLVSSMVQTIADKLDGMTEAELQDFRNKMITR